jgi:hypothetical protein
VGAEKGVKLAGADGEVERIDRRAVEHLGEAAQRQRGRRGRLIHEKLVRGIVL